MSVLQVALFPGQSLFFDLVVYGHHKPHKYLRGHCLSGMFFFFSCVRRWFKSNYLLTLPRRKAQYRYKTGKSIQAQLAGMRSWWLFKVAWPHGLRILKIKFFNFSVCNPSQSSPSLTILVPLWFIIISLVFFYLSKLQFSGFLQLKGNFNFQRGQNISK